MIRSLTLSFCLLFLSCSLFAQQRIIPFISARVDTSKTEIREIYHTYTNYLNSQPDSSYKNPYWNKKEYAYYLSAKMLPIDRAAEPMFNGNFQRFIKYYKPTVLQIDSLANNLYQVKTMFKSNAANADKDGEALSYITNLYARKDSSGVFKLENAITERTKDWKKIKYKFITYIVHPSCNLNKKKASEAVEFCLNLSKRFNLDLIPFKYYILPNTDEFGKLLNFDYWTYYFGAQTNLPLREIFTSYGNENYPHELVHMMFPLNKDASNRPNIVNEGLATWLAGPKYGVGYEESLRDVSQQLKKYTNPTVEDIKNGKIRNQFDSNILYVTGAVLCKMVYEKKGTDGIRMIYNSTNQSLDSILEMIFDQPIALINKKLIDYILVQS